MRILPRLTAFGLLLVTGCGSADESPPTSDTQELVDQATFKKAFKIVSAIDYLPWEYKVDGCYARALYMSMELAAEGIPSNAAFAFADEFDELRVGEIEWQYHVAPMLQVGASPDV